MRNLNVMVLIGLTTIIATGFNACSEYKFSSLQASAISKANGDQVRGSDSTGENTNMTDDTSSTGDVVVPVSEVDTEEEYTYAEEKYSCDKENDDEDYSDNDDDEYSDNEDDDYQELIGDGTVSQDKYEEVMSKVSAQDSDTKKVEICHVTPNGKSHEICVSVRAMHAFINDKENPVEDYLGKCKDE